MQLQELLDEQHQVDQGGPQAKHGDGGEHSGVEDGGEGAGGGRHEHGGHDDQLLVTTSMKLQLVRRRYRLKVGIKRDGLLQPTVNNFFVNNSGRGAADVSNQNENTKTGSWIRMGKRKLECTEVLDSLAKRKKSGSQEGH